MKLTRLEADLTRIPEPALIRSAGIAITGIAAFILGRNVSTDWVESLTMLYGLIAPFLAGILIRPAVTPVRPGGEDTGGADLAAGD